MFGFFKEMVVIGQVSSGLGKLVKIYCGRDFLAELSTRDRNLLAESTLTAVKKLHNKNITEIDSDTFDDLIVAGFMNLARQIGPSNAIDHQFVLIGMMAYINEAISKQANISLILLKEAKSYLELYAPS